MPVVSNWILKRVSVGAGVDDGVEVVLLDDFDRGFGGESEFGLVAAGVEDGVLGRGGIRDGEDDANQFRAEDGLLEIDGFVVVYRDGVELVV